MFFHDPKKEAAVVLLYDFDQLDDKLQQKIIDDSRVRFAADIDFDFDISSFLVDAEEKGLLVKADDIRFSFGDSDADGASFTTEDIDFRKIISNSRHLLSLYPELNDKHNLDFIVERLEGRIYCVEPAYTTKDSVAPEVIYNDTDNPDFITKGEPWLNILGRNIEGSLLAELTFIKDDLCDMLFTNLQATYDNELSDEKIRDFFRSGGSKFFVDGTRVNPAIFDYSDEAKKAKAFMALPASSQIEIGDLIDKETARLAQGLGR